LVEDNEIFPLAEHEPEIVVHALDREHPDLLQVAANTIIHVQLHPEHPHPVHLWRQLRAVSQIRDEGRLPFPVGKRHEQIKLVSCAAHAAINVNRMRSSARLVPHLEIVTLPAIQVQ
jgi:hypothetical protein